MENDERTIAGAALGTAPPIVIGVNRWKVLRYLLAASGDQRPAEIARATDLPPSTVFDVLAALGSAGFLAESHELDRTGHPRGVRRNVGLTESGRRVAMGLSDRRPASVLSGPAAQTPLAAIRRGRGVSQGQVAARARLLVAAVRRTERSRDPLLRSLRAYAEGLGADVEETVFLDDLDLETTPARREVDGRWAMTLVALRRACNLTQPELARRSGLSIRTVAEVERRPSRPGTRRRYVEGLGGRYVLAIVFYDGEAVTLFESDPPGHRRS
jgi:transcriptional regulator with XRE-family HTH domain